MSEVIKYNIEGTGNAEWKFRDGNTYELPAPNAEGKQVMRKYWFTKNVRDSYLSDGNKLIEIGVTYRFGCSMTFLTASKEFLNKCFKAQNDDYVEMKLNKDKPSIKFNVRVTFDYEYIKGFLEHKGGYTINLSIEGSEELDESGYEGLASAGEYGSDYGQAQGNSGY